MAEERSETDLDADGDSTGSASKNLRLVIKDEGSGEDDCITKIVLVGDGVKDLYDVAQKVPGIEEVFLSDTGLDYIKEACEYEVSFVVSEFEGEVFTKLHRAQVRIIGPTVLQKCSEENLQLPHNTRPLYSTSMKNLIVCFTGFKQKAKLIWLVDHVHYMGGHVRKDEGMRITHMVANITHGPKYRYAVNMGKPIMSEDWIMRLWEDRRDMNAFGGSPAMNVYRMKPFYECCLGFLGFPDDERKHMEEMTLENGGTYAEVGSKELTHLVVDNQNTTDIPSDLHLPQFVVKGEWFWGCIQMEACADEHIYIFETLATPTRNPWGNHSLSKTRKRKRLQELVAETEGSPFMAYKRRSSSADMSATSMSPNSFLDMTYTPDKSDTHLAELKMDEEKNVPTPPSSAKMSKRQMVARELLQTEENYVGILHTVLHIFKAQIEKLDQYNGPILAPQDTKIIFGNIPAIYETHCKLRDSIAALLEHWSETHSIGDCILDRVDELMKAYPSFVNFFENTKETIQKCDRSNPRFHAFLKVCQSKPECGRQSLQELLIRPVQRLPSVILLLSDLAKRTDSSNPDKAKLDKAIEKLKDIMTHINEDKRKTEGLTHMFDIVHDIDNCPVTLLSANRHFVMKVEVMELSNKLATSRGDPLTLFLFSDSVEICKRRCKAAHGSTSRSPALHKTPKTPNKGYKHLEMFAISSIKRVLDVIEAEDCRLAFGLIVREANHTKEELFSFTINQDDASKQELMTAICKNVAAVLCRPDHDTFMAKVNGEELNITTKDLKANKAIKFSRRVSRAFSFSRTPNTLKRAVTGMIHGLSPFVKDSQHAANRLGGVHVRRLASTFDLTETDRDGEDSSDTMSLGAYSLQDETASSPAPSLPGSPERASTLASRAGLFLTPSKSVSKAKSKWATLGPSSASKSKYL